MSHTFTLFLVMRNGSNGVLLDIVNERAGYKTAQVARHEVAVALNKPFHDLMTNMLNRLVHILKLMTVPRKTKITVPTDTNAAALLGFDPGTIGALRYKHAVDRDSQLTH